MVVTRYKRQGPKLKIAVVADLHDKKCDKVLQALKQEQPDIIVIPGDLTSYKLRDKRNRNTMDTLCAFVSLCPVFYSRGNHEWMWDDEDIQVVRKLGVTFLENEFVSIGDFAIGGLKSEEKFGYMLDGNPDPDTSWLSSFMNEKGFHILLSHQPEKHHLIPDDVELVISGHAHGAQMILFGRGVFAPGQGFFPKMFRGEYGNMILSAGLKNTAPFIPRIGNPTELVIIEIGEE